MSKEKEKATYDSSTLYKDKYCKLTKTNLRIRTYYFPTGQDKIIDVDKIQLVYYKKQCPSEDCCQVKGWGMSFTPVWWACDLARGIRRSSSNYYNVAIDTGSITKKGFTVININEFLASLRQLISPEKFIPEQIPL
uniref:PC4 domain-containing protein n=1 Tax=Ascaris lumbricoides TaxID=6252 RepID=A0A0M3I1C0_ASCLU